MRFSSLSVLLDKYQSSKEKLHKSALFALGALSIAGHTISTIVNSLPNNATADMGTTAMSAVAGISAMVGTFYLIETVRQALQTIEHRRALKEEASHYGKSISDIEMQYSTMDRI